MLLQWQLLRRSWLCHFFSMTVILMYFNLTPFNVIFWSLNVYPEVCWVLRWFHSEDSYLCGIFIYAAPCFLHFYGLMKSTWFPIFIYYQFVFIWEFSVFSFLWMAFQCFCNPTMVNNSSWNFVEAWQGRTAWKKLM